MAEHAALGASGATRWLNCPGSLQMSQRAGGRRSSVYADEGHAAHELGESCLSDGSNPRDHLGKTITTPEGGSFVVDADMADAVAHYVDYCREKVRFADDYGVEDQVDLDTLTRFFGVNPPAFGTADFWCVSGETLTVVDYKHGRGIAVSPVENDQLRYYALAVLLKLKTTPIKNILIVVVQPRAGGAPVQTWEITERELISWAVNVLGPGIERALEPDAPLRTGSWCRFCPAKPNCPLLRKQAAELAQSEFSPMPPDPKALTDDQLGRVLDRAELIHTFVTAVRQEAHERATSGSVIPGYKLVQKRAMRRWRDAKAVDADLGPAAFPDAYAEPTLKSVAQVEKSLPPEVWAEIEAKHVVKESSGTTLVPEGSPQERVEAIPPGSEFADLS